MKPERGTRVTKGLQAHHPDAALLLKRLEEQIVNGDQLPQAIALLENASLCRAMNAQDQLRWAELAQMAGRPHTAVSVLERLHQNHPDLQAAWQQHLALLAVTGPPDKAAALLARARPHIGDARHDQWVAQLHRSFQTPAPEQRRQPDPFDAYHHRQAALQRFLALFAGRGDCFARQWADRKTGRQGYVPERRVLGAEDIETHLLGGKTYGIYLLHGDGRIQCAVLDADLKKNFRDQPLQPAERTAIRREAAYMVRRLQELSQNAGSHPLVEFSGGKGYHFWYFFQSPTAPGPVRQALGRISSMVAPDLTFFNLEVFPKQDHPGGKGLGNLVKLPLGIHRATGKRSFFPACKVRSTAAQLDHLATIVYSSASQLAEPEAMPGAAKVLTLPRGPAVGSAFPQLATLQTACAPMARIVALCLENGRITLREEKILYQTLGFLPEGKKLLHHLLSHVPEYNPHLVDYRLSRLRGTPLGCRRIHDLTGYAGPDCHFERGHDYRHPLLHLPQWTSADARPAEKAIHLAAALDHLQTAIEQVERFLK